MEKKFKYGEQLFRLRTKSHLSQENVALSADISTSYYGQIERGIANPSVETLEKICDVLGVRIYDIFYDGKSDILDPDKVAVQITHLLSGKTKKEKELIFSIVKSAAELCEQKTNKNIDAVIL